MVEYGISQGCKIRKKKKILGRLPCSLALRVLSFLEVEFPRDGILFLRSAAMTITPWTRRRDSTGQQRQLVTGRELWRVPVPARPAEELRELPHVCARNPRTKGRRGARGCLGNHCARVRARLRWREGTPRDCAPAPPAASGARSRERGGPAPRARPRARALPLPSPAPPPPPPHTHPCPPPASVRRCGRQ